MSSQKIKYVYATSGYYHGDTFSSAQVEMFGVYENESDAKDMLGRLLGMHNDIRKSPHSDSYSSRAGVFWVRKLEMNVDFNQPVDMRTPQAL